MIHRVFTEFEAYAEVIQDASMDMRLPSLKAPRWEFRHASVGQIHVQHGQEGGGNIAEGSTFRAGWTFFQQSAQGRDGLANGCMLAEDEVFVIPPGKEFCLACQPQHDWVSVFLPSSDLPLSVDEQEVASASGPLVLRPANRLAQQFRSLVCQFLSAAQLERSVLSSPAATLCFREELVSVVRQILQSPGSALNKHYERWRQHTHAAIKLVSDSPDNSLSVATLAQLAQIPERTLRTAFQRRYGISPQQYLQINRLRDARRALRASCPDQTSVTEVAIALGFWDLGRFASRYRKLFGEKPSVTLQTSVWR
ncbi:helix-turn-helix domain-containing protein [Stieleria sp. TO1_6]|uniref:AraC family transcriptional regulator n=1 Tax=Stieleria tagensis TaxID=2956795 RepID=UPI00209B3825|nr:AraC family transcriptional regulator [Stieleria tagensis]MCO8122819.1 helix-turn-helix domain-containing protein [Stieleria tagensis]